MDINQFLNCCIYFFAGVIGLCVGSFLNVVIYRVPREMSLSKPSSHCTACSYKLKWFDNIPVLSFLMLKGKCRSCKQKISPRYTIVELANALLWVLAAHLYMEQYIYMIAVMIATSALICIFFIDLEHMLIFDRFHFILLVCAVCAIIFDSSTKWYDHIIGSLAAMIVFLALYYGSILLLKKEGLGFGDVKYAIVTGLLLGWQKFILSIFIASITAAIIMITANRINKTDKQTEYPFAPFLVIGTLIALFFGNFIIEWYMNLLFGIVNL